MGQNSLEIGSMHIMNKRKLRLDLIKSIAYGLCWQYCRGLYNIDKYEHTDEHKHVLKKAYKYFIKDLKKPFWKRVAKNTIDYYLK